METDYTVRRIDEMESAFGGLLIRARAELGVTSFGMGIMELPPNSGDMYPEHDHSHTSQEEVFVVLEGNGEIVLPDKTVELDKDVVVRVGAATRRRLRSGPSGLRFLAIGGTPGEPYTIQPNSELGAPETVAAAAQASSSMFEKSAPPQLDD
ncbi:MAG TPA: cupin domain-containing protein [Solirubrobacterales bacterium]|jgi:mannose-6-phosphate isomerase-like protein (cupin superfamily)